MSDPTVINRRMHPAAVASFVLGLLSVIPLTGLLAMYLGLRSLRAVNGGDGRLRGARLAIAGMVLGGVGTVATLLGMCAIVVIELRVMSNQAESTNHLRMIGLALNKYADNHETFPPATRDPRELPPDQRLSWMADVVGLLDESAPRNKVYQDLGKKIDRTRGWADPANAAVRTTSVRAFLGPDHSAYVADRSAALTYYVGVAGINPGAADLPRDNPRAGMFGNERGVKRSEVTRGISFTMMVLETTHENGPWLAGGFPTVRGLDSDVNYYSGPGRPFGGLQSGKVNVLFVDGSVKPWSDATPGKVFREQATIHRREEEKP